MRVRPVVRDLASVVVSHEIGGRSACAAKVRGTCALAKLDAPRERLSDEAVHLAAVDVVNRIERPVRAADVSVVRVVEGADAAVRERVRDAHGRTAVFHRDPVRAGKRAEVRVEGAVLLHDHDHVLDRVNARGATGCRQQPANRQTCTRGRGLGAILVDETCDR